MRKKPISKMNRTELFYHLGYLQGAIAELRDRETQVFAALDRFHCKSDDPSEMCLQCNCWKRTRELCS